MPCYFICSFKGWRSATNGFSQQTFYKNAVESLDDIMHYLLVISLFLTLQAPTFLLKYPDMRSPPHWVKSARWAPWLLRHTIISFLKGEVCCRSRNRWSEGRLSGSDGHGWRRKSGFAWRPCHFCPVSCSSWTLCFHQLPRKQLHQLHVPLHRGHLQVSTSVSPIFFSVFPESVLWASPPLDQQHPYGLENAVRFLVSFIVVWIRMQTYCRLQPAQSLFSYRKSAF